jgi:hypothetical protein
MEHWVIALMIEAVTYVGQIIPDYMEQHPRRQPSSGN